MFVMNYFRYELRFFLKINGLESFPAQVILERRSNVRIKNVFLEMAPLRRFCDKNCISFYQLSSKIFEQQKFFTTDLWEFS